LSEYSFLEKRHGTYVEQEVSFNSGEEPDLSKPIQGYFEYNKINGDIDKLLFIDGKAYLKEDGESKYTLIDIVFTEPGFDYPSSSIIESELDWVPFSYPGDFTTFVRAVTSVQFFRPLDNEGAFVKDIEVFRSSTLLAYDVPPPRVVNLVAVQGGANFDIFNDNTIPETGGRTSVYVDVGVAPVGEPKNTTNVLQNEFIFQGGAEQFIEVRNLIPNTEYKIWIDARSDFNYFRPYISTDGPTFTTLSGGTSNSVTFSKTATASAILTFESISQPANFSLDTSDNHCLYHKVTITNNNGFETQAQFRKANGTWVNGGTMQAGQTITFNVEDQSSGPFITRNYEVRFANQANQSETSTAVSYSVSNASCSTNTSLIPASTVDVNI